jgi:succinate dehydrogenase hydrophobic anchor subunit
LTRGPGSWDAFVSLARSPYVFALDVILLAGALIHGLNGLRVALTGFDVGVKAQKALFVVLMLVAAVALGAGALKIFGG